MLSTGRREPLAFEVAAEDPKPESLIKRHPPKKFQKLEEQQSEANITQELLEEKQAIAEKRRKEASLHYSTEAHKKINLNYP